MAQTEKKIFEEYLQKHGLKMTRQRKQILEVFLDLKGHLSAEEIYAGVRQKKLAIGFATVYRTLHHLKEAGLIQAHDFGGGRIRYEVDFQRQHHDHLVCEHCGKLVEFVNPKIEALQEKVGEKYGFKITSHRMQLFGICRECRKEGE